MTGMYDPAKNLNDAGACDMDSKQSEAATKQDKRKAQMGELMRSKGFIWMASSMFLKGAWQQAGNVLDIKPSGPWLCEVRHTWEGTPSEPIVMSQLEDEFGEVKSKQNLVKLVLQNIWKMNYLVSKPHFKNILMETDVKSWYLLVKT